MTATHKLTSKQIENLEAINLIKLQLGELIDKIRAGDNPRYHSVNKAGRHLHRGLSNLRIAALGD